MASRTVSQELAELHWWRPGVDASPEELAAWQGLRRAVLEHMAAEGSALAAAGLDRRVRRARPDTTRRVSPTGQLAAVPGVGVAA
jgi:hypothetical protein